MRRFPTALPIGAILLALSVVACEEAVTEPTTVAAETSVEPMMTNVSTVPYAMESDLSEEAVARITAMVDRVNAGFAAAGTKMKLHYPWLFRVGIGVDPWGALRTGSKWPMSPVTYGLDEADYTAQLPTNVVDATLVEAYETWNDVPQSYLQAVRVPFPPPSPPAPAWTNWDILDGTFDASGECVDVIDVDAENILFYDPNVGIAWIPAADILVGGWLSNDYFLECLGSSDIIGVTWFFSFGDANGDNYVDQIYVEQFYNEGFLWVTQGATLFGPETDLESIAAHENGHSHGMGHFGGPRPNQPLLLRPTGQIFNPEAVMNPGYFGGEKRNLLPPDEAGLRTMYGGPAPH